jgi:hypothetical protein
VTRRSGTFLLVCVAASGCMGTPAPDAAAGGERCYQIVPEGEARDVRGLPWGVQLLTDTTHVDDEGAPPTAWRRAVGFAEDGSPLEQPFTAWRPIGDDSLSIGHRGRSALELRVGRAGDGDPTGVLRDVGDAVGSVRPGALSQPLGKVRLAPVVCPDR